MAVETKYGQVFKIQSHQNRVMLSLLESKSVHIPLKVLWVSASQLNLNSCIASKCSDAVNEGSLTITEDDKVKLKISHQNMLRKEFG